MLCKYLLSKFIKLNHDKQDEIINELRELNIKFTKIDVTVQLFQQAVARFTNENQEYQSIAFTNFWKLEKHKEKLTEHEIKNKSFTGKIKNETKNPTAFGHAMGSKDDRLLLLVASNTKIISISMHHFAIYQ